MPECLCCVNLPLCWCRLWSLAVVLAREISLQRKPVNHLEGVHVNKTELLKKALLQVGNHGCFLAASQTVHESAVI